MARAKKVKTGDNKLPENVKEQKSIIESIMAHKELISIVLALGAVLYPIINTAHKIVYQGECEKFYGVPGKYFNTTADNGLLYLGCVIIFALICIVPRFIKKYAEKNNNLVKISLVEEIFYSVIFGVEIGVFNILNLLEIMKKTHNTHIFFQIINNWLDDNAWLTVGIVVVLGSLSVLGITLIDRFKKIKSNWIRKTVCGVLFASLAVSILIMIYGTIFKLTISIEDKTKYEFVAYDEEYVVLSVYNEKLLVAPFEINENGQYIFRTGQYWFVEADEGTFRYRDIKYSPKVDLGVQK